AKRREVSLYPPNKRWWFEEGSQFRAALDAALKSVSLDWPIRAFLWSGANSVHARDRAASELSEELRKDLQDPNATAVIIAHSHGGSVALRAISSPWQAGSGLSPWRPRFLGCSRAGPGKCHMGLALWGGQSALAPLLGIIWIVSATVGLPDSYWFFGSM